MPVAVAVSMTSLSLRSMATVTAGNGITGRSIALADPVAEPGHAQPRDGARLVGVLMSQMQPHSGVTGHSSKTFSVVRGGWGPIPPHVEGRSSHDPTDPFMPALELAAAIRRQQAWSEWWVTVSRPISRIL